MAVNLYEQHRPREATITVSQGDPGQNQDYSGDFTCTGAAADEVEFNAAIVYLNGIGGGKLVVLESTYYLDDSIQVYDDIWIDGMGTETILSGEIYPLIENQGYDGDTWNYRIRISNMKLYGGGSAVATSCHIRMGNIDHLYLDHLLLDGVRNNSIDICADAEDRQARHIYMYDLHFDEDIGVDCITISNTDIVFINRMIMEGCAEAEDDATAISLTGGGAGVGPTNVNISDVTILSYQTYGIGAWSGSKFFFDKIRVFNCPEGGGINLDGEASQITDVQMDNLYIEDCRVGIGIGRDVHDVEIHNPRILDTSGDDEFSGQGILILTNDGNPISNIKIIGGTIEETNRAGIEIREQAGGDIQYVKLVGVVVKNPGKADSNLYYGYWIRGALQHVTLECCEAVDDSGPSLMKDGVGIEADTQDVKIFGGTYKGALGYGINVLGVVTNCNVFGADCRGNTTGPYVNNTGASFCHIEEEATS